MNILYLIPNLLDPNSSLDTLSPEVFSISNQLKLFFVENEKTARAFLKKLSLNTPIQELQLVRLDKDTSQSELTTYIELIKNGQNAGIISDAGCPCIADPGSALVRVAQENNITVKPLVGPSSILLGLMASGLNGQSFCFHGYIPVEKDLRIKKILELEKESKQKNQTQIFIETPYRNQYLFEDIINNCQSNTKLTLGIEITSTNQTIKTKTIHEWKKEKIDLDKKPCVFLILS